ncbi:DedA family protein [Micromonospora soli]|uniref:DedA family protein n=1 Tax=Micromonospora sp. NBRC 110009 TaxID=3061627 RepID=UPI0026731C4C|nr:DedA family protein [Micromonospora sp. NBRC 110009]WKT97019.1 DedA family protein [Micromonospora sp. NBRC 110009]
MTAALTSLVVRYGYLGLALLVGVESLGIPAPGETAIIAGAGYAAHGELAIIGVTMTAFLAAVIGDSVGYLLGRTGGRRIFLRYGRYVRLTPERFAGLEAVMSRHGPKIVVVARFVEGLRQFNGIIAGATGMPWRRFVLYNALGAAAWVGVWATAGYVAGDHIRAVVADLHRYQWYVLAIGAVAVLAYAGWRLIRRRARR